MGTSAQEQELTAEQIRERIRQRAAARAPQQQVSDDEIRNRIRSRGFRAETGRDYPLEGPVPPMAEPILAQPPRAGAVTEPAAPAAAPLEPRLEDAGDRRRRELGTGLRVHARDQAMSAEELLAPARAGIEAARGFVERARTEPEQEFGVPIVAPSDVTQFAEPAALADPYDELTPRSIGGLTRDAAQQYTDAQSAAIRHSQKTISDMGIPLRAAFAVYSGSRRVTEAALNPLSQEGRKFTQWMEQVQSGGGLVPPMDEHRHFLTTFGMGLAEMVPVLVSMQAAGVMGAAGRVTAGGRAAMVGALEKKFGRRAATRIFQEALKESAEEGLSVAVFESVIGRGAGQDVGGRLKVFGEEVLAETGGFVLGAGFGAGRQVFRELGSLSGPISRQIMNSDIQSPDDILGAVDRIAQERQVPFEQVMDEFSAEGGETVIQSLFGRLRGGAADVGTMREIRGERAELAAEEVAAIREDPVREYARELADNPSVGQATTMRALAREFPRMSDDEIAAITAEVYNQRPLRGEPEDVTGRPQPVEEPAVTEPERARERDPQVRAGFSRQLATIESSADRKIAELTDPDVEGVSSLAGLEDLQRAADDIITEAASAGENALVDRAARLSARLGDAIENPPVKPEKAPEKPPEAAPSPEPAKPAERPAPAEEAPAAAIEKPEAKPEKPAEPEAEKPAEPEKPAELPERLGPTERLDPAQRSQLEEIFPEAKDMTDEELAAELAGLGTDPIMRAEEPAGRRITDLSDDELVARVEAAGGEVPAAGPEFRERLLEVVDPGATARLESMEVERRELRGRLAEEMRGRRAAERGALVDERTGLQNQKAFIKAQDRAIADENTQFVELDIRNLKVANDELSEAAGNELIVRAGNAVRRAAEESGIGPRNVFRSGGDEFVILAPRKVAETVRARAVEIMGESPIGETGFTSALRGGIGNTPKEASIAVGKAKKAETGRARGGPPPKAVPPKAEEPKPAAAPEPTVPEVPAADRVGPKYEELVADPEMDAVQYMEPGKEGQLLVERPDGRTDRLDIEYGLIELAEIRESHLVKGKSAERSDAFPEEVQTRERFDPEFVQQRATEGTFDEGQLILESPTAERGPPIIQGQGVVLGGNNRAAIIRQVYMENGPAADRYRKFLKETAADFGLTPEQVADFGSPVLVRRIKDAPTTTADARALADDLNRTAVRSRTGAEEATLAGARLTDETLAFFDQKFPVEGTLRSFLNTADGVAFAKRLRDEGTVSADQVNRFFEKDGTLNAQGRDFIEDLLLGRALGSAEAIEQLPAVIRNRLIKAAPAIAGLRGKFDIRPALQEAALILGEQSRSGQTLRDFLGQEGLGLGEAQFSGPGKQLAMFLSETKTQKGIVDAFRRFRSASDSAPTGQGELLPSAARSPRDAFTDAFGKQVLGEAPPTATAFASEMPAARPVTPGDAPRLKLTPEKIAALKKMGVEITPEKQVENLAAFRRRSEARRKRAEGREIGKAKRPPVQPRGAGKRGPEPPAPDRERAPGESGGGPAGTEKGDVNPEGEPKVAAGQRKREANKKRAEEKKKAREEALRKERERFDEAEADQDAVADIEKVRATIRSALRAAADEAGVDPKLVDDQLRDIERIQRNLLDEAKVQGQAAPGFLVGNSPGTGKTYVGAGAIQEAIERATAEGREARILVVVPGKADGPIVKQWQDVAQNVFDFEMKPYKAGETPSREPGVYHMSATGLGNMFDPKRELKGGLSRDEGMGLFDLVVFDESHLFSNIHGANRAMAAGSVRKWLGDRVLHLSATPFEFPWDMAYLDNLRLWGKGRKFGDFDQWLANHGIRRARGTKNTYYFVKSQRQEVLKTLMTIRREMIEAGVYTQRAMKVDKKLQNDFVEVKLDESYGNYYHTVMDEIANLERRAKGVEVNLLRSARVTFTRRISELAKIPSAIKLAKQLVDDGRSVAIFTGYKIDFALAEKTIQRFPSLQDAVESLNLAQREGVTRIVRELGGDDMVGQVHGARTGGQRTADISAFQSGKKKVMVATVDAGGTGLSLHDLLGDHPRAQLNLTAPWTGKAVEQLAGRTYRVGTKSDTQMIWFGIDTPIERELLGRVAIKMESLGALVKGKVSTDADKLAMFDFLPEAELQQHLFGYKKDLGQLGPTEMSADYSGKENSIGRTESDSMRSIEEARLAFESETGLPAKNYGTTPAPMAAVADLELPRPNVRILKPSQTIGKAARQMLVRAFLGGIKQKNVLGRFKIVADMVRLRSSQNVRVAVHELAHHLDKNFFGFVQRPTDLGVIPGHLQPFVDELRPMQYAGAKDPVVEGFAEFVAEYVTRPKYAQEKAPRFFKYFRDHLNRTSPGDLKTLDWMREQHRLYLKYPPAERIGSRMIIGDAGDLDESRLAPGRRFKQWYHNWMDYQAVFRDMDQMMMRQDPNWRSLQMLGRRTHGAEPLAENMMSRGWMDFNALDTGNKVKRVSKGLPEIFKPIDSRGQMDLFRYWATALRAKELQGRGLETGMEDLLEDGTVDQLIRQIDGSEYKKVFADVWADLQGFQDAGLKWLQDSGNLTADQIANMKKLNQYYIPWQRLMSEPDHLMDWVAEAKAKTGGVDGLVGLPPAVHRFKGDTRPIIDPIESIVSNARYFTQLGFRKQVENQIAKFSDDVFGADGHAEFISTIDPKLVASRFSVKQVKAALETLGIRVEDVTDEQLAEILTLFSPMTKRKDIPAFQAIVKGKRQWYQIHDPDLWDAVSGLNKVEFGWLTNLAITSKAVLRNGVVMSPEFMVRNFIRDAQTAWIQTPTRGKGAAAAARRIPMVAAVEGLAEAVKAGKLWDEFVASGAAGSALTRISRKTNQEYMRQMFGRKGFSRQLSAEHSVVWNARQAYQMVRDMSVGAMHNIQHVGSLMENANRLSTFRAQRETGADFLEAGFGARNVSTDFAVHGAKMQAWRLSTAFLNPAAQGTARTGRAFKDNPLRTLARSSALTFASAALWWYNQQDPDYPEYSANLKSRYWIWRDRSSGTIYRLPKTYIYGDVFGSFLAEAFLDYATGKDPDITRRLGIVMQQAFGFTLVPTLILPALEVALNKSLYFDTPIESQGMRDALPTEFRSRVYTSEAAKKFSEAMARFAESADTRGLGRVGKFINDANLSPVQYDHLVRGYFGTMGFDIWNEIPSLIRGGRNAIRKLKDLETIPAPPNARLRNHFFIRGFTIQFPSASAESIRRFYERRGILNEIATRYAKLQAVDEEAAVEFRENHLDEISTAPLYEQIATSLAHLSRQKATATSPEQIDAINRDALNQARDALKLVGDLTPAEQQVLQRRTDESAFLRGENRQLQDARNAIEILVTRRQLQGHTRPTENEAEEVATLIRSVSGLTGGQRASLRRYYRGIRQGSLVEREAGKTSRTVQRRFRQSQREP